MKSVSSFSSIDSMLQMYDTSCGRQNGVKEVVPTNENSRYVEYA